MQKQVGAAFSCVKPEPVSRVEAMGRYWNLPMDFLCDNEGNCYGLHAKHAAITRYRTHDTVARPVFFEIHGLHKLVADGKIHWPLGELVDQVDDENPHLYRAIARSVVRAMSADGRLFNVDTRYGVLPGIVSHDELGTMKFTIADQNASYVMLYANKPLNSPAGRKNWDMVYVASDDKHDREGFYVTFIPFSEVADISISI